MVRSSVSLVRGFISLWLCATLFADELQIKGLGDPSYRVREATVQRLVAESLERSDEIIDSLLEAEKSNDPEIAYRAATTLQQIFLRLKIGVGAPQVGLVIKSKLVTHGKKLGTRPLVDVVKEGTAAMKSGLKKGDIILSVNGLFFDGEDGTNQLKKLLRTQVNGARLKVRYARKSKNGREEAETILVLGKSKPMSESLNEHRSEFQLWKSKQIARKRGR